MTKTVFIGAGNLATNLATELKNHSFQIVQVFSRTISSARILANKTDCDYTDDMRNIITDADLYIFSISDSALPEILLKMPQTSGVWVHTAGSIPMDIFKTYASNYGVVYPFQTFSKNRIIAFKNIPVFVEANNNETLNCLKKTFAEISDNITELSSEKRKFVHLTGVYACNFVNHMYAISQEILEKENIPFDLILPLIDETARKVHSLKPKEAQTGPAVRYDTNVIDKHLSLLKSERQKEIYKLISEDIFEFNKKDK